MPKEIRWSQGTRGTWTAAPGDFVLFVWPPGWPIPDGGHTKKWTWETRRLRGNASIFIGAGETSELGAAKASAGSAIQIHERAMNRIKRERRSGKSSASGDTVPATKIKPISEKMFQWIKGGNPIHVVASHAYGGHPVPQRAVEEAITEFRQLLPGIHARLHGWTAKDERDVKHMIRVLELSLRKS